jgi:hypothetical protein
MWNVDVYVDVDMDIDTDMDMDWDDSHIGEEASRQKSLFFLMHQHHSKLMSTNINSTDLAVKFSNR